MPELGRAALVATLGSRGLRGRRGRVRGAGRAAAGSRSRPRTRSSRRSGRASSRRSSSLAALVRHDFSFVYVAEHTSRELPTGYTISAFWGGQEGSLLLWLLILTGYSTAALLVNRRTRARPRRLGDARARRRHLLLRLPARRRRNPVRDAGRAGRRQRAQPEPPEPVHDGPPAAALPRLRRPHRPVRLRDGRAARAPHRRALDRRDPPLDARRLDGARRRPAARLALGLRGGRLGRLLRLGSGRERRADAVARRDRVPALGDDPGEARHAARLEPPARRDRRSRSRSSGRS